ncbi:penicillin-binding protein 1A [Rhizobium sp. BK529]|uniref:transglycosylase domain-containing protein n=1 Tax=Rhizobium sp. BK529 TaxID=2586983 RepID=UPI00161B3047|nr:transglycosylase domain-containing protein [Rhizobium sp. BK529]MBB3592997.1 penicillin-binding protein 1A [Rhizobium sp. BK529]
MVARRRSDERIEPSFNARGGREDDEFALDDDDRIDGRHGSKRQSRSPAPRRAPAKRRAEPREREGGGLFSFLRRLVYWCIVVGIWAGIGVAGLVLYYGSRMPSASTWAIPERPPNVKITAVDGSVIANRGTTGGEALSLETMSPYIPEAVIAIEDRRFYSHFGVDPFGLARAFINNLTGQPIQGGSTLTQQLAKNLFLSPDRTLERKVQEVLLSFWLEQKYTKDQILAMYLNRVYFGSNAYGVEAASRRYFNKSARDVNLGEAALLAGLVKAPSRLSPARDPEAANARAQVVLQAMRDQGYISADEIKTAMSQTPASARSYWSGAGQYVADMVMDELQGLVGDVKEDVIVDTTIDKTLEKKAEQSLVDVLDKEGGKFDASQAALVSIDGTGAIRALVGGRDYATSQFNRAVKAKRQPGSSFKPFVYAAALEKGLTPDSVFNDAPIRIGNWTPENYEKKYNGEVTLRTALAKSLNTVAAQLVMYDGPDQVIKLAHRLGVESDLQPNASIALGTSEVSLMELTASYAAFMNGGYKATPHVIRRVTTTDGKVLYENTYDSPPRVLSEQIVAEMNMMMMGVINGGTGSSAKLPGWQAAGKTGTTQNSRDALFVGFTSNLTTGVWFGNDDGKPMKKVTGGGLPAKAWKEFMVAAHKGLSPAPLFGMGQTFADPGIDPNNGQPMAQAQPMPEQPSTVGSIISGVFGGNDGLNRYPPVPDQPRAPMPVNGGPVPPADVAGGGYDDMVPPGDVGGPQASSGARPRHTTLLDLIMGQ